MKPLHIRCALLLFLLAGACAAEYAPNLRLDPDLSQLVYRLASRYHLATPRGLFDQPMNAGDIALFVAQADSLGRAGVLSRQEAWQLEKLKASIYGRGLYSRTARDHDLTCRLHAGLTGRLAPAYSFERSADSLFGSLTFSPELRANLGRLSFYGGLDVATEYRNRVFPACTFEPYDGVSYTLYGRADSSSWRAVDLPRAGLLYWSPRVTLESAVDQLRLGPAVYSPVTLSGEAPPITYFRARFDLGILQYEHAFGLLRSQKDRDKYIYQHRIDIPVERWGLNIGLGEVTITGTTTDQVVDSLRPVYYEPQTRDWEWVYMIPFMPFSMAEHYLGDRDNSSLTLDLNLFQPRSMRWYAELLLDDITAPWTLFSDDWGNKWALTAGCQYFGRILSKDITATLEYSRVEPWVYTHFYGGSHNFEHFGQCLGAPTGPNSEALRLGVETEIVPQHTVGLALANFRKGSSRGSAITDVFQDTTDTYQPLYPDSWTKEFLGTGTRRATQLDLGWRVAPFSRLRLETHCIFEFASDGNSVLGSVSGGLVF